ncbi:uncharacterized protein M8220_015765 isoform 1-T1 [Acridotheres tristis]
MEEAVMYADLRFPPAPAPQQRMRLPWSWLALSLGLLSLMLLLAQIILVSLSFHYLVQQQTSCTHGPSSTEESPSYGKQTLEGQCQFCPVGWLWDAGQCYYFSSARKSWEQSREDCCSRGAQLVTIQANTTLAFLVRTANMEAFHVGLKQDGIRSDWKWLDGTTLEGLAVDSLLPCAPLRAQFALPSASLTAPCNPSHLEQRYSSTRVHLYQPPSSPLLPSTEGGLVKVGKMVSQVLSTLLVFLAAPCLCHYLLLAPVLPFFNLTSPVRS